MFLITGTAIVVISMCSFIFSFYNIQNKGTLDINWSTPKGIRYQRLLEGDRIEISFSSDENLSVYLLSFEEAEEYRSARMYKDPLPQPIFAGKRGEITIIIKKEGDYELLFWNESFSSDHRLDYEIHIYSRDRVIFLRSVSIILLLTGLGLLAWSINWRNRHQG